MKQILVVRQRYKNQKLLSEFKEFPLKKIRGLEAKFKQYDADQDHALNIEELKKLMEGLGEPQTHRYVIFQGCAHNFSKIQLLKVL